MKMEHKCKRNIAFPCTWRQTLAKRTVYPVVVAEGVVSLTSWVGVCSSQCGAEAKSSGERNQGLAPSQ